MIKSIPHTSSFFAGYVQFDVQSSAIDKNLSSVRLGLAEIAASHNNISPGIIVLPELWATGFAYKELPVLAEKIPDLLKTLHEIAVEYQVVLAGSLPEYAGNRYYNTLYLTAPHGNTGTYRKQRLFGPMDEDSFFTQGTDPTPLQTPVGPIAGMVCYDLRFPELLRQQTARGANLLVVPAQWPAARINHWRVLLQARAIENQMFVVGANRCGITGDTTFGGHSMIIAPDGSILLEAGDDEECGGVLLDAAAVSSARSLFSTVPAC